MAPSRRRLQQARLLDVARAGPGSERAVARQLEVPRTTLQYWRQRMERIEGERPVVEFFESAPGVVLLHRVVTAARYVIVEEGGAGIRVVNRFLELAGLWPFVATSYGSQQEAVNQMEELIYQFGDEQVQALGPAMPHKVITVCADETFHEQVCLVAIEPVSNYILLERYSDSYDAVTWKHFLDQALSHLNVEIVQLTSDQGKALVKLAGSELGVPLSPDLMHVQQELVQGVLVALGAQTNRASRALDKATERRQRYEPSLASKDEGTALPEVTSESSPQLEWATRQEAAAREDLEQAVRRQDEAHRAVQAISEHYHPFDLETGESRSVEQLQEQVSQELVVLENLATEAGLSDKSLDRVQKVRTWLGLLLATLSFFHQTVRTWIEDLAFPEDLEELVLRQWLPAVYLARAAERAPDAHRRRVLRQRAQALLAAAHQRDGPLARLAPDEYERVAAIVAECADLFQRSSSCVEGRNGHLRLRHHGFRSLGPKRLRALNVVHNFGRERNDGTTAAERLFAQKHPSLFGYLLERMPMPARPARETPPALVKLETHVKSANAA
jgi:hypothetical protein